METPYSTQRNEILAKAQSNAEKANLISALVNEFKKTTTDVIVKNLKDSVSVDNLIEVRAHLANELNRTLKPIERAIKSLDKPFPDVIKVSNLQDIPETKEVKVTNLPEPLKNINVKNLDDIGKYFVGLAKVIQQTFKVEAPLGNIKPPEVNVTVPDINIPEVVIDTKGIKDALKKIKEVLLKNRNPNTPMAVRLSDGEQFIEALKTLADGQQVFFDGTSNMAPLLNDIKNLLKGGIGVTPTLPAGAATAAKQLADGHNVVVTSLPSSVIGPAIPTIDSYTSAPINVAVAANTEIISAPGASKQIWIYGLVGTANVAGTISLQDEDDAAITGIMPVAETGGWVLPLSGNFSMPWKKLATNKAVEIDTVTCTFDGIICYAIVSV